MAATGVIRFPPPPPTRNELTTEQRAKLIRTNNKLGQVLGSTPHVLDITYRVQRPRPVEPTPVSEPPVSARNPFRTHSRRKSLPKVDMEALRASSPSSVSTSSSSSSRKSTSSVRSRSDKEHSWRSPYPMQHPPLLKLSTPSPSRKPNLETIPGSPPFDKLATSIDPPSFSIPSDAALRREKMRRLRKKLGDNVPSDLVFGPSPPESESDSEEDSPLITSPTSRLSREWLLVDYDKKLPEEPRVFVPVVERPLPQVPIIREPVRMRHKLFKERPKDKPSKGAQRLDSIAESTTEARADELICVGVAASAGMAGKGKSRRFVKGPLEIDQIGGAWGG
ncbi:hypothetical protein C8Q78DRAFT_928819, partial [Trametes maxima]